MSRSESSDDELVRMDYRFEMVRLQSYNDWNEPVSSEYIEVLAKSGLYYTGEGDNLKCFDCYTVISGWKEDVNPLIQHKQKFPNCRFILNESSCGNVPLDVDVASAPPRVPKMNEILQLNRFEVNLNKSIKVYFENTHSVAPVVLGDLMGAASPAFALFDVRLQSYTQWPETLAQKKEDMAFAGFIYKNEADKVECFYCGGCIENWEPHEEPLALHLDRFTYCKYIKRLQANISSKEKILIILIIYGIIYTWHIHMNILR